MGAGLDGAHRNALDVGDLVAGKLFDGVVDRVAAGGDRLDSCAGNTTPIGVAANDHGAPTLKSPDLSGAPLSFDCHKRGARRVNEGTEPDPADPGTGRHDDLAIT